MATFNKFYCFVEDQGRRVHDLNSDVLKMVLTNSQPSPTNTLLADIGEIAAGHGYSAGGAQVQNNAYSQVLGIARLTGKGIKITATGGSVGPFRFAVLYNASRAGGPLIGWEDYGSNVTLNSNDAILIGKDSSGADWDSVTPLIQQQ